jgi:ribosome maturation factor RimP
MSTHARLQELIEPIVVEHGLELFDLHFGGAALTVLVDRPRAVGEPREKTGVDMEAITSVTRAVSRALDDADPISSPFTLEVSSPGLERPLRTPAHFAGARGELVSLKMVPRYEGDRRLRGTLERVGPARGEPAPETASRDVADEGAVPDDGAGGGEPGTVTVRLQAAPDQLVTVSYDDIEKAKTVFEWNPEPKSERPGKGAKRRKAARGGAADAAADAEEHETSGADEAPEELGGDEGAADGGSATTAGHDAKINGDDEKVSAT